MTDTTIDTRAATLSMSLEEMRAWLAPVLPFAAVAPDRREIRTVELHTVGNWVLASATNRFISVVHRVRTDNGQAAVSGPLSVAMYATDLQHLLAAATGCATEADSELEEDAEHGDPLCNPDVRVTIEVRLAAEHRVHAWWTSEHRAGTSVYLRGTAVPDWSGHPARILSLKAISGAATPVPADLIVAPDLLSTVTKAAALAAPGYGLQVWSTASTPTDAAHASIGWSAGEDLIGLLMPLKRRDIEPAPAYPRTDSTWDDIASTASA